jgi:hypothetical protein
MFPVRYELGFYIPEDDILQLKNVITSSFIFRRTLPSSGSSTFSGTAFFPDYMVLGRVSEIAPTLYVAA